MYEIIGKGLPLSCSPGRCTALHILSERVLSNWLRNSGDIHYLPCIAQWHQVVNIHITRCSPSRPIIRTDPSPTCSSTGTGCYNIRPVTFEYCLSCIASTGDGDPLEDISAIVAHELRNGRKRMDIAYMWKQGSAVAVLRALSCNSKCCEFGLGS